MIWLLLAFLLIMQAMLFARIKRICLELKRQKAIVGKQALELADLFQELKALLNADIVLDRQLKQLKTELQSIDSRQENIELDLKKDSAYHQAIKLLKLGELPEEVMKTCNLTKAEVDLLSNLNGYQALIQRASDG